MNLSDKSKEIIATAWKLKTTLSQNLPPDLIEYIIELIAKDQAHQKLIKLLEEQ